LVQPGDFGDVLSTKRHILCPCLLLLGDGVLPRGHDNHVRRGRGERFLGGSVLPSSTFGRGRGLNYAVMLSQPGMIPGGVNRIALPTIPEWVLRAT
jgi:hypothetical protein